MTNPTRTRVKWLVAAAAAALFVCAVWSGALAELADPERLRGLVRDAGPAGPVVFVAVVVILFPVLLAGPPIWLSGTLWPLPLAILYSALASAVASGIFYLLARRLGRDWAAARIPDRLRPYEARLEQRPLRTVVVLRLLLWINPAVDLLVGVSSVPTRSYVVGSVLVLAPLTVFHVTVPAKGIDLARALPRDFWPIAVGILAALLVLGMAASRLRARRGRLSATGSPTPSEPHTPRGAAAPGPSTGTASPDPAPIPAATIPPDR